MSPTSFQLLYPAICTLPFGINIIYHSMKKCKSFFIFFSNNSNGGDSLKEIFYHSAQIAAQIVENGGEISKAEESVIKICKNAGAENINVFIIPSLVFASAEFDGKRYTAFKRIYNHELNLGELENVSGFSAANCGKKEIKTAHYSYPLYIRLIAAAAATAAFCIYFGGTATDALFCAATGSFISILPTTRLKLNFFSKTLVESTVCGALAFLPLLLGAAVSPDKIMTGTIMLLIPGMSIGNAMKDMMSGDIIAGILEITQAFVIAFAIVLGYAGVLLVMNNV